MSRWFVLFGLSIACRASNQEFLDRLEPQVVGLLCDHDRADAALPSYYRKCFDIDEAQCTVLMQRSVHACAGKLVIGEVDESNAGVLAERIGACAGTDYEQELDRTSKRIRSDACDIAREEYAKSRASAMTQQ